jgi:hypothetical protein
VRERPGLDGAYELLLFGEPVGTISVHATIDGSHLLGSPVDLRIEAALATPGRCYAFGAGLGANGPVPLGRTARFTIVSCDISGTRRSEGGDQFLVQITPLKSANHLSLRCKIADLNNGAYTVAWSPPFSGGYKVHITLRGLPIFRSPFVVKVEGSGQYVPGSTLIATRASDKQALSPEDVERAIAANPSPTLRGLRSAPDPSPTKLRQPAILLQSPGPAADAAASLAASRACTEAAQAASMSAVVERVAAARAAAAGGKATAVALARAAIDAKLREAQQLDESELERLGLPPTPRLPTPCASTSPMPPLGGFAAATAASRAAAVSPRAAAAGAGGAAAAGAGGAVTGGGATGGAPARGSAGAGAAGARGGASSAGAAGRPMAAASVRPFLSASASAEELLAAARVAAPRDDLDKLLARFQRAIDEDDADEQHADALRGLSDEANRTLGRAEELAEALGSVYGHARFGDVEGGSTTAARGMATPRSARSTAQGRERAFSPD